MPLFDHAEFSDHERIVACHDSASGLKAIIAIHDTTLGPAAGGCRLYPYADSESALTDVLRLSKAMTYKNALAGLPLGGGKSVIIANPNQKTASLLAAFARGVNGLAGQYWTAEDINMGTADIDVLAVHSQYVFGLTHSGNRDGDPSPFTAAGCVEGLCGALQHRYGSDSLNGRHVAIQGVGNVGYALAGLIVKGGGRLTIADTRIANAERVRNELGAEIVDPSEIYTVKCDVFAPCAMGGTLNEETIPLFRCAIVCGAANNQLAHPTHGALLMNRGITYAPDYVVNAGGMLSASADILGVYDLSEVRRKIRAIRSTVCDILDRSARQQRPTNDVADALAMEILVDARQQKSSSARSSSFSNR